MTHARNENGNLETSRRTSSTSTSTSSTSTSTSTSIGTTTGGISTEPGVSYILTDDQWEELAMYYERCLGTPMPFPVAEEMREYNQYHEMRYELFRLAMRETAMAPRPTARYFLAILSRCAGEEVLTELDWRASKAERENHNRRVNFWRS